MVSGAVRVTVASNR